MCIFSGLLPVTFIEEAGEEHLYSLLKLNNFYLTLDWFQNSRSRIRSYLLIILVHAVVRVNSQKSTLAPGGLVLQWLTVYIMVNNASLW